MNPSPGPWSVYKAVSTPDGYGIDAANGFAVVWFDGGIRVLDDAQLIAAAPDLLAACEVALDNSDQVLGEVYCDQLRAAITKARGGQ